MRDLRRCGLWGLAAAGALTVATYAGTTASGHDRLRFAIGQTRQMVSLSDNKTGRTDKAIRPLDAQDGQRLAETVRTLTADRDRLQIQLATLERSVGEVSASLARFEKAAQAPMQSTAQSAPATAQSAPATAQSAPATAQSAPATAQSAPATAQSAPATAQSAPATTAPAHAPEDVTASIRSPAPPATQGAPTKGEFGLDLGGANTIDGLRVLWATARQRHGTLLDGLRPVVHVRERPRSGGVEMRLVAGPIPNAVTAARMCATLVAAGAICQPSAYDGQRLAAR
jgi:hypothetical protein